MKVGITGASGFLGSAIIEEGRRRGWSVVAFSRRADRPVVGADEVRPFADIAGINLNELDALIHLAGEPITGWWSKDKKRKIRGSRVDLTRGIVEAITAISRSRRPSVFVSASAIGYYGDRSDEWLDEESDVGFGFLAGVCRDWESASARGENLGVRIVNPRIGLVLGHGGFLKKVRTIFKLGLGGRLGRGYQWMSWIHVQDLARIFAECVENPGIHGRVNCVSPNPATNREFTTCFARVLGRKAIFPVPAFLLNRLPGGMGRLFLDSQRVEPVVMKSFDFEWNFPDLEAALRDIETKT